MHLPRIYHRLRAFLTGYAWGKCPICHLEFGGHEKGGGIFWRNEWSGQITCPNCPGNHGTPPKYPIPINKSEIQGASTEGDPIDMGNEPLLGPGVRGLLFDRLDGVWIPYIRAEKPGSGDVGRYLNSLPTDRRIIFPTVLSPQLREMLERRGYTHQMVACDGNELEPDPGPIRCHVRMPKETP